MRISSLCFALCVATGATTQSAHAGWGDEYAKRVRATELVTPLGDGVFGDSIKLFDGTIAFSATDISIPGNNALPVQMRRTLDLQDKSYPRAMHDWQLDIPYIGATFAEGYAHHIGCDQPAPPMVTFNGHQFLNKDYWHGTQLHVADGGGEMLVPRTDAGGVADEAKMQKPTFAVSQWRTKDGWFFECIVPAQGTLQGYKGYAPDGTRYTFDHLVVRGDTPVSKQNDAYHAAQLFRQDVRLYVSKIEDRFGNAVAYEWTGNDLTEIESTDGRKIQFAYTPIGSTGFGRLDTATAHGRTWTYGYGSAPNIGAVLTSVTNPDLSTWTFDSTQFENDIHYMPAPSQGPNALQHENVAPRCAFMPMFRTTTPPTAYPAGGGTYSITHPSGAKATYTLVPMRHGRTNVPIFCQHNTDGAPKFEFNQPALYHDTLSVTSKKIEGPALDPVHNTYTYTYSDLSGDHAAFVNHYRYGSYTPSATPHTKTVTVTEPDQRQVVHSFGKDYELNEGRLLQTQIKHSGVTYETTTTTYVPEAEVAALPMPDRMGKSRAMGVDDYSAAALRPVVGKTINRDSVNYQWTVQSNCHTGSNKRCLDAYGRPTTVRRHSTLGDRTDTTAYYDDKTLWVLGQVKSSTNVNTGLIESRTEYYPATALPWETYAFEQRKEVFTYSLTADDQNGTLSTAADGSGLNAITLSNWKRGIPQTITYPTTLNAHPAFDKDTALVNDRGEIDWVKDELGYKTCYTYDLMGRLASITHPSESQADTCNATTWAQTTSSFVKVPAGQEQYGLPAGHWRHTVTTGTVNNERKKETFYDAFWRPIFTRESTTDGSAGVRAVRRMFDWSHREVFASYPIDAFAQYTDLVFNAGTDTAYDPLGRVTGTAVDSELAGVDSILETYTSYANGQTVHTNARNYSTTTTYQAFDQPSLDAPLTITAPEGITTIYTRDVFGKPHTLSRSGTYTPPGGVAENLSVTRRFVYDTKQRLCKTKEPDAGITIIDYDAAGNVAWRATGRALQTSDTLCEREAVTSGKSENHYDALNRLLWINHPDGTSDVGYTYAPDGAMLTASVSATTNSTAPPFASPLNTWTYTYKRRRLLESETLALDGKSFPLTWSYNARGDVSGLTYPSGHAVTFNPNAYGEPRQVGSYAHTASYHPYGGLAGFTYGNTATRAISKNARQLPGRILDTYAGSTRLDHTLTYDQNGNLKNLTDASPGAPETRAFTYDQRDRLTAAGTETYAYDVLDNVRRSVIGGVDRRFKVTPATNRLLEVTREGSVEKMTYAWNDRGELTTRTQVTPGTTTISPPTIFRTGFEEPTNSYPQALVFDQAGRLVMFDNLVTHQYDAHNRRVRTSITSDGTRYQVYSKAGELLYVDDSILRRRTDYMHLNGVLVADRSRPLAPDETVTVRYQHSDHRGTPLVKTLNTGAVEPGSYKRLSPFGTSYENVYLDEPGFTKHLTDGSSSMSYMQQRYYDPNVSGFISPDPIGPDHNGFSRYAYANNNPYTFVDPDGRQSRDLEAIARDAGVSPATAPPKSPNDKLGPAIGVALTVIVAAPVVAAAPEFIAAAISAPSISTATATSAASAATAGAHLAREAGARGGAVSALVTKNGEVFVGASARAGGPGAATSPSVQRALDAVAPGARSAFHGCCGEIDAMSRAANAGAQLSGSAVATVRATGREAGRLMESCSSCRAVAEYLGVIPVKPQ